MKKAFAIAAVTALIVICGIPAKANNVPAQKTQILVPENFIDFMIELKVTNEEQLRIDKENEKLAKRLFLLNQRMQSLNDRVGKTWYVFSGSTPQGWDCSGLVLWFYSEFGIILEHSATAQASSGEIVEEPMIGDIVSFKYNGSNRSYHNGIYAGDGLYIHAPKPGKLTSISDIALSAGNHSSVVYTRINIDVLD
jgi:hypothetical protein